MRKHRHAWRAVIVAAYLLIAQIAVGMVSGSSAAADSSWPIGLNDVSHNLLTHGNGSVTSVGCQAQTFRPDGLLTSVYQTGVSPSYCTGSATAGTDGAVFSWRLSDNGNRSDLVATKNGTVLWSYAESLCANNWSQPVSSILGYDGNLYALLYSSCSPLPITLKSFEAATGNLRFSVNVLSSLVYVDNLRVVPDGVILLDPNTVWKYDYSGQQVWNKSPAAESESMANNDAVNAEGNTYVPVVTTISSMSCTAPYYDRVVTITPSGVIQSIDVSEQCIRGNPQTLALPDGGVAIWNIGAYSVYSNQLYRYSASGTLLYAADLGYMPDYTNVQARSVQIDASGDIIVVRNAWLGGQSKVFVDRFGLTSSSTRLFDTVSIDGQRSTPLYIGWNYLANGLVYLPICNNQTCAYAQSWQIALYKISAPGTGLDYPRSAVFAHVLKKRGYVAVGDSISSGEGNPTFLPGTDTPTDKCHRSPDAYPMLLDQMPTADLDLVAFRACSGATTDSALHGSNTESGQLDSISTNTRVITVSIGGNDAQFGPMANDCVDPSTSCDEQSVAYQNSIWSVQNQVRNAVHELMDEIEQRIGGDADVYVIGYPHIVQSDGIGNYCPYLSSGEKQAIVDLTDALNVTIERGVSDEQDERFHFVPATGNGNPFDGHSVCGDSSYFVNVLNADPIHYTFHPNRSGQQAYAELIANAVHS